MFSIYSDAEIEARYVNRQAAKRRSLELAKSYEVVAAYSEPQALTEMLLQMHAESEAGKITASKPKEDDNNSESGSVVLNEEATSGIFI